MPFLISIHFDISALTVRLPEPSPFTPIVKELLSPVALDTG